VRFLSLAEVLRLHANLIAVSGGAQGLRDLGRIESALAQPLATFDGSELYPNLHEKAAALGFALIQGHPFVDGNKRIGHAAMEVFLLMNGQEISAPVDEQERTILAVASGQLSRNELCDWIRQHAVPSVAV
jgi:death on curing protein